MKMILTSWITKSLMLLAPLLAQVDAFASDSDVVAANDNPQSIFSQPWIWIGIITAAMVIVFGPSFDSNKNFAVIRKKPGKKGTNRKFSID